MSARSKGKRYERKLVEYLKQKGWKSKRVPASVIDVIATKADRIAIFEVKYKKNKVKSVQVKRLFEWLDLFDAYKQREAVLAIYNGSWLFMKVNEIKDYVVKESNWMP
jgi:Holliday junction resolvase